jgi:hypothetical protein
MKTVLILCVTLVLALSTLFAAQSSRSMVNVSYDKFEDLTEVSTTAANVDDAIGRKQEKQDLRLQVFYKCTGDTSHCRHEEVELKFASHSVAGHIRSDYLVLIAEGKRMRLQSKWSRVYAKSWPVEQITAAINVEDFLGLARAEKVEGKLGETTFVLSGDNLAAIRAVAGEIGLRTSPTEERSHFRGKPPGTPESIKYQVRIKDEEGVENARLVETDDPRCHSGGGRLGTFLDSPGG